MVEASTAPPAVAAAVPSFVASCSAVDVAWRPVRPLKRSRKEQAADAAGLSVWAQAGGLLRARTRPSCISPPPPAPPRVCPSAHSEGYPCSDLGSSACVP
jgi:hypothetical protein